MRSAGIELTQLRPGRKPFSCTESNASGWRINWNLVPQAHILRHGKCAVEVHSGVQYCYIRSTLAGRRLTRVTSVVRGLDSLSRPTKFFSAKV